MTTTDVNVAALICITEITSAVDLQATMIFQVAIKAE